MVLNTMMTVEHQCQNVEDAGGVGETFVLGGWKIISEKVILE